MEKVDRRILRTRRQLAEAILTLLLEKEYEAITIQEITDRADLNRATFYLHYGTREELLVAALEAKFDELVAQIDEQWALNPDWSDDADIRLVFEHVAAHAPLYKVLMGENGRSYVINRIIDYITEQGIRACVETFGDLSWLPIPIELVNRHIAGSLYAQLSWWIQHDMPYSPERMAHMVHTLCMNGIDRLLASEGKETAV